MIQNKLPQKGAILLRRGKELYGTILIDFWLWSWTISFWLGIPMNYRKLKNKEWKAIQKHFKKKPKQLKTEKMSYGCWLLLVNSALSNWANMMSFIEVQRYILIKKLDFYRSSFFRQGWDHKKKYRLTKYGVLCLPKEQGILGITNIEIQNDYVLNKWLYYWWRWVWKKL